MSSCPQAVDGIGECYLSRHRPFSPPTRTGNIRHRRDGPERPGSAVLGGGDDAGQDQPQTAEHVPVADRTRAGTGGSWHMIMAMPRPQKRNMRTGTHGRADLLVGRHAGRVAARGLGRGRALGVAGRRRAAVPFGGVALGSTSTCRRSALVGPPLGVTRPLPSTRRLRGRFGWLATDGESSAPPAPSAFASGTRAVARYPAGRMGARVLVIDNYDSFVYNLVQYLGELGAEPMVHRADALHPRRARGARPRRRADQPGPGRPEDAGLSNEVIAPLRRPAPGAGRVPRPPVHRPGLRRRRRAGARRSCTARPR